MLGSELKLPNSPSRIRPNIGVNFYKASRLDPANVLRGRRRERESIRAVATGGISVNILPKYRLYTSIYTVLYTHIGIYRPIYIVDIYTLPPKKNPGYAPGMHKVWVPTFSSRFTPVRPSPPNWLTDQVQLCVWRCPTILEPWLRHWYSSRFYCWKSSYHCIAKTNMHNPEAVLHCQNSQTWLS